MTPPDRRSRHNHRFDATRSLEFQPAAHANRRRSASARCHTQGLRHSSDPTLADGSQTGCEHLFSFPKVTTAPAPKRRSTSSGNDHRFKSQPARSGERVHAHALNRADLTQAGGECAWASRYASRMAEGDAGLALRNCPLCGTPFACGAGGTACWCAGLPPLAAEQRLPLAECLCRSCLEARIKTASSSEQ
jgi:hypothetical protein